MIEKNIPFIIFATFSRRFDELHNKNNSIHLQASVAAIRSNYDYLLTENPGGFETVSNQIIIIRIYPDSTYFFDGGTREADYNFFEVENNDEILQITVIEITIESLIGHLIFDKTSHRSELMHQIFGAFNDRTKDAENIASNCLFEFRNGLNMANITTLFKISNIDISGGNISNRGALKSTQFNLSWFLINLYNSKNKEWLNYNIIYPFTNTTSNSVLSFKVNDRLYDELDNQKSIEKFPYKFVGSASQSNSPKDESFFSSWGNYIRNNAEYTKKILISQMVNQTPIVIQNIQKDISELTSQVKESIKSGMIEEETSKYSIKKYRKQKEELESKKIRIESLKNELNKINKWFSAKDSWNKYDLSTLTNWHEKLISNKFAVSKRENKIFNRSENKTINPGGLSVRKYSTTPQRWSVSTTTRNINFKKLTSATGYAGYTSYAAS